MLSGNWTFVRACSRCGIKLGQLPMAAAGFADDKMLRDVQRLALAGRQLARKSQGGIEAPSCSSRSRSASQSRRALATWSKRNIASYVRPSEPGISSLSRCGKGRVTSGTDLPLPLTPGRRVGWLAAARSKDPPPAGSTLGTSPLRYEHPRRARDS